MSIGGPHEVLPPHGHCGWTLGRLLTLGLQTISSVRDPGWR